MTIKITKATDGILTENLIILIYGTPGVGKSTLAFSANRPLLLDFDLGAQRAVGRKDSVQIHNWSDVANLSAEDLIIYDTIIIDTAGRALEILTASLISSNPRLARSTGELQLQGYGALGVAFKNWLIKLRNFNKDIILICHDKEEKNGDNLFVRPDAIGSSRIELTKVADLMGYFFMDNKSRKIDFNPTENHLGKNCAQIQEQNIPNIAENPNFMAELLEQAKQLMNAKSDEQLKAEAEFNVSLALIAEALTADECTALTKDAQITANVALKHKLLAHATELGFIYDRKIAAFSNPAEISLEEPATSLDLFSGEPENVA
jgi:hypothetical protein